jgi:N-acetyl-alpha-D-muramate 1-phosphate uridylyltransferase
MLRRSQHTVPACAMVMAAGLGTRMRPLTLDRPKPLVQIGDETLLDHVLRHAHDAGISHLVVNVHYLADQIEAHLAIHAKDFNVDISDEREMLLETGGGLMQARPMLSSDPFLCINTDNIWIDDAENSITKLAAHWDDATMDALMLLVPSERAYFHAGAGDFFCDNDGRLRRRGDADSAPYIWPGIQMLSQRILTDPPSPKFSTNILWDRALAAGRLYGVIMDADWYDVGTPEAVAPVAAVLAAYKAKIA